MAHSKSALKRWRQNDARRRRNRPVRTAVRTAVKRAHAAVGGSSPDEAQAQIRSASSTLDRAAKRGVIHRNAAARHKSRLMRQAARVAAAARAAEAPKKPRRTSTKAAGAAEPKPRATRTRTAKPKS